MEDTIYKNPNSSEGESERSLKDNHYSSVEFSFDCVTPAYIFRIWDMLEPDLDIIVKEDSAILQQIQIGDILKLKYLQNDQPTIPKFLKTEIKRIAKSDQGFQGHYSVGLRILENQEESLH